MQNGKGIYWAIGIAVALNTQAHAQNCTPAFSHDAREERACARDARLSLPNDFLSNHPDSQWNPNTPIPFWDSILGPPGQSPLYRLGLIWEGQAPLHRNETEAFYPASTMKLWTAWFALNHLGKNFRFTTELAWKYSELDPTEIHELRLIGDGDPTWGMQEFGQPNPEDALRKVVQHLKDTGIRRVHGPIQVISSSPQWDFVRYPEGWRQEDFVSCFGAQPQGFNLGGNCAELVIQSHDRVYMSRSEVPVSLTIQLRPGNETRIQIDRMDSPSVESTGFQISGTFKKGDAPFRHWLPVHHAREWTSRLLISELKLAGIQWVQTRNRLSAVRAKNPLEKKVLIQSPPLQQILVPFLKRSLNWLGESLIRKVGQNSSWDSDTSFFKAGMELLQHDVDHLLASLGLPQTIVLKDGSGVSHASWVTPLATLHFLEQLQQSPEFHTVWDALPIAGVDGTLEKRMKGTAAENWLRGKTGTLSDAYNLAGYIPTPSGALISFVQLVHTQKENGREARALIDRTGSELARLHRQTRP